MLEHGLEHGRLPALRFLFQHGSYTTATSTFPSVTPVCLTSIATGAHPDVHHVPHLVWYHRGERRIVEYGSSFPAMRAVGARQSVRDTMFNMSHVHLNARATTVFEAIDDAGLEPGAINFTCYRGRTRHAIRLPELAARTRWYGAAYGPKRFFFFNVFESDVTGAPLAVRSRVEGSNDAYAAAIGRWLVTRDGFDFLVFYLPDYDYASHRAGPSAALHALERSDASLAQLMDAAGGFDEFLERYAIVLCSDHGQTPVAEAVRLAEAFDDLALYVGRRSSDPAGYDVAVTASNRSGMVYRLPACRLGTRALAERLDGRPGVDLALFAENGEAVARKAGGELRFRPDGDRGWHLGGDPAVLDPVEYPNGLERAWRALACPSTGEVIVSAADGYEFIDLGGRAHVGGGSHGSLAAADSVVPVVTVGVEGAAETIADLAPLVLRHFGIAPPPYARVLAHAA